LRQTATAIIGVGTDETGERWSYDGRNEDLGMNRTVLVVDDDPSVLEVVAGMLEDLGCK
jgi:hypothetical protein